MLQSTALLLLLQQLWVVVLRHTIALAAPCTLLLAADHLRCCCTYLVAKLRHHLLHQGAPQDAYPQPSLPTNQDTWPCVAVQLPIFNERAVCSQLIDAACLLQWPHQRLLIQVLDDSTDTKTRQLVDDKVLEWRERGVAVSVRRRTNRQGYKAGALREGMGTLAYGDGDGGLRRETQQQPVYVAVLDADFRPDPDFLLATIPFLEGSADVAFVQTRWVFANATESYLTRVQQIALNYHFKCQQYAHFAHGAFFNFNGTAGVWRVAAIDSVGGWLSRTTVEDMDLSVRTYLHGWRAVFLDNVTSVSELPSSLYAYRKQQHRWTAGPVQLLMCLATHILQSPLSIARKAELLGSFFLLGKVLTHVLCVAYYCTLAPLGLLTPGVHVPLWSVLHAPAVVALSTCAFTGMQGVVFVVQYVLFQNAMALVKAWAVLSGALGLRAANEWVVTTKLGRGKGRAAITQVPTCRVYVGELVMAGVLIIAAAIGVARHAHVGATVYLLLQGLTFMCFGLNMVDCRMHGVGAMPLLPKARWGLPLTSEKTPKMGAC